jgi:hypothetical protein
MAAGPDDYTRADFQQLVDEAIRGGEEKLVWTFAYSFPALGAEDQEAARMRTAAYGLTRRFHVYITFEDPGECDWAVVPVGETAAPAVTPVVSHGHVDELDVPMNAWVVRSRVRAPAAFIEAGNVVYLRKYGEHPTTLLSVPITTPEAERVRNTLKAFFETRVPGEYDVRVLGTGAIAFL